MKSPLSPEDEPQQSSADETAALKKQLAEAREEIAALTAQVRDAQRNALDVERRFQYLSDLLSDSASSAVLEADGTIRREWYIDRALQAYGYTIEDIETLEKWREIVHPDDLLSFDKAVERFRKEGRLDGDLRIVTRSGETRWIHNRVRIFRDHLSGQTRLLSAVTDITPRKVAEQEILTSRASLMALVESTDDLIWSVDAKARIVSFNTAFKAHIARRFGVEVAVGMDASLLVRDEALPFWSDLHAAALSGEKRRQALFTDAEEHLDICANPIVTEGRITGVSVFARNVTAHRNAEDALRRNEEQLRQTQKLESIGQLAGGVAHDLNNLLTPILAYSQILRDRPVPPERRPTYLGEIYDAAERASGLVGQLLAFSRKQVLSPQVMDLRDIVRGFERVLHRTIRENVRIEIHLPAHRVPVCADTVQLEQVLLNLAVNAQDAMPDGGVLQVEVAREEKASIFDGLGQEILDGQPLARLSVGDTGHGIDETIIDRIFEPFFTTKDAGRGTGLGLSTVYGIAKQHGGHARARNLPEAGAVLDVLLPLVLDEPVSQSASPGRDTPSPAKDEARIFVVEDNEIVRQVISKTLEMVGYRVTALENAEKCLEALRAPDEPIDLLLTDVVMPGMNGKQLVELLVQQRPRLKVIFMSGYDRHVLEQRDFGPCAHFLRKPFDSETLLLKVQEALGHPRA
jgi:PAS domain S-box-containing protein